MTFIWCWIWMCTKYVSHLVHRMVSPPRLSNKLCHHAQIDQKPQEKLDEHVSHLASWSKKYWYSLPCCLLRLAISDPQARSFNSHMCFEDTDSRLAARIPELVLYSKVAEYSRCTRPSDAFSHLLVWVLNYVLAVHTHKANSGVMFCENPCFYKTMQTFLWMSAKAPGFTQQTYPFACKDFWDLKEDALFKA